MTAAPAIILFAHGARDPRWALPFESVAQAVRLACPQAQVSLAFLEFMSPGLVEAAEDAIARGATEVQVVPLFLGAGGHVRKDLPALLETLSQRHSGIRFDLQAAIGEREAVIQAMAESVALGARRCPDPAGQPDGPKA